MSLWFDLKGKAYTGTPPVSWLKKYVEYLTDKLSKEFKQTSDSHATNLELLRTNLGTESTTRRNADNDLLSQITTERNERKQADSDLLSQIAAEQNERKQADTDLLARINTSVSTALVNETSSRIAGDQALSARLDALRWKDGAGANSITGAIATTSSDNCLAFGENAEASHTNAIALGKNAIASGQGSVALGTQNTASGSFSVAMGIGNTASGLSSTALGKSTLASGVSAVTMGSQSQARGSSSFAVGEGTIAAATCQIALGKYNVEDTDKKYALIVGNGSSKTPSNGFTLDWSGNIVIPGTITASGVNLNEALGDVETALDSILAMQTSLIGGDAA